MNNPAALGLLHSSDLAPRVAGRIGGSRHKKIRRCLGALFCAVLQTCPAVAQDSPDQFYRSKKVNLIIGSSARGGYDIYARLIGKYLSRYIPGNPIVVVSNMAGASSNVAAAYIAGSAPKDGTTLGALYMGAVVEPLFYGKTRPTHNPAEFNYIGNANTDHDVCVVRSDAPLTDWAQARSTELVIGASAPGGATYDFPAFEKELLGLQLKIVNGYPGSREVNLALEKGEVQGVCGQSWGGVAALYEPMLKAGALRLVAQESNVGHPSLNALSVPLMRTFARSDFERNVLNVFYAQTTFSRPYVVAKEVPADRVAALRDAFMKTVEDPELVQEARQLLLDLDATPGEALQEKLKEIYAAPPDAVAAIRKVYATN